MARCRAEGQTCLWHGIVPLNTNEIYFFSFCRVRFPNEPLLKAVWETAPAFLIYNSFPQQKLIKKISFLQFVKSISIFISNLLLQFHW